MLTRITVTLSCRGFNSARIGLVFLLWPGVELALLAERWELRRCGSGSRTIADSSHKALKENERRDEVKGLREKGIRHRNNWVWLQPHGRPVPGEQVGRETPGSDLRSTRVDPKTKPRRGGTHNYQTNRIGTENGMQTIEDSQDSVSLRGGIEQSQDTHPRRERKRERRRRRRREGERRERSGSEKEGTSGDPTAVRRDNVI